LPVSSRGRRASNPPRSSAPCFPSKAEPHCCTIPAARARFVRAGAIRLSGVPDVQQLLDRANDAHRRGQLRDAEPLCRAALALDPGNADATAMLGALALQTGDAAAAEKLLADAVTRRGDVAAWHNNLAIARAQLARFDDAE